MRRRHRRGHTSCDDAVPGGRTLDPHVIGAGRERQEHAKRTNLDEARCHMNGKGVKNVVTEAKDGFVGAIEGVGDIAGAIVDTVSSIMVRTLRGTNAVGGELLALGAATVTGVVEGVAEVGTAAGSAARSIMVGALRGAQQVGKVTIETVSTNAGALVRGTADVGGDVGHAARGAVEGAIDAARDLGISAEEAAGAAAAGALKAAGDVSTTAVSQVRKALTGSISGVKDVLKQPFRSDDSKRA
jgi:hypothetical protein